MLASLIQNLARLLRDERGAVSSMLVLMLIPLVGMLGMATEASSWYLTQRTAQNAADSAAMAAAINGGANYGDEAKSVATQFGFTTDTKTTVTPTKVTCPNGTAGCYQVAISRKIPIYLVRIVGFNGDSDLSGGRAQTVSAVAIASQKGSGKGYCMTALGSVDTAIDISGAPNLGSGCSILVPNGGASCTNQAGGAVKYADVKVAAKASKKCGDPATGGERLTGYSDPTALLNSYDALKNNLPAATTFCGSYGVVSISGPTTFSIGAPKCGTVKLTGDVTVTSDSVLLIENGDLNLQTFTLKTAPGVHLTIIFSGTTSNSYSHTVTGTGVLDIYAPTSGTWQEMAIYQDPLLTKNVDLIYAGSKPDFNISGIVYAPHAKISISGDIGPSTNGDACLSFVSDTIVINGTANIFANPTRDCTRTATLAGTEVRQALVQ